MVCQFLITQLSIYNYTRNVAGTTQAAGGDRGSNNFGINKHTHGPQLHEEGFDIQVQGEASSLVCSLWSGIKSFNKISTHLPLM